MAGDRWQALAAAGARPQRPLWASTGVKDPAYDDTRYVVELVAPNTVNTMPEATMDAVEDHGEITGDTVRVPNYQAAHDAIAALAAAGIDMRRRGAGARGRGRRRSSRLVGRPGVPPRGDPRQGRLGHRPVTGHGRPHPRDEVGHPENPLRDPTATAGSPASPGRAAW